MVALYGIKNCDTMKNARAWFDQRGVAYVFHDHKAEGIDRARLEAWAAELGWEALINRSGTTFRKLPDAMKADLDESSAISLMQQQPAMIKRPVVETGEKLVVGFKPEVFAEIFI